MNKQITIKTLNELKNFLNALSVDELQAKIGVVTYNDEVPPGTCLLTLDGHRVEFIGSTHTL